MATTGSQTRVSFLDMTPRDEQLLIALRPLVVESGATIVNLLCEHLLRHPDTAQLLEDTPGLDRMKQFFRDYLLRITDGKFDDEYFAHRVRIGQTHERIGLSPRWSLLGYHHCFRILLPLVRQFHADDPAKADDTLLALHKVFMLDASLALDAYIASDRYRHLRQLESIVNDSADVIFLLDTENRVRTWNRAAEHVFGWRAEEIIGKPFAIIVPPELIATGELERIDYHIRQYGHYHFETLRVARDNRRIPVEVTVSLVRDAQGVPLGRSAILRDITERRRLEDEKLRAERLATVGAMSAKLAHEIRNPLSSITLNMDLVRDEIAALTRDRAEAGAEANSLLKALDSEVRRIQRVTEDYLAFARMPKPQREPVDLNQVLRDGLSFMQSLFDAERIELQTDFAVNLPRIHADENQLWQAILNLIRNSIEAMPGGGALAVATARRDNFIRLTIADNGKGMTLAEQNQMFKPFFSTKSSGTGLGLPLTQQIISEHGGTIRCETAPNRGTTFIIELPQPPEPHLHEPAS
jgi:PAS domain S-box-containing protein